MKSTVRIFRIASLASVAVFLLISILHSISYLSAFGVPNPSYFNPGAVLPSVTVALAFLWALVGIILAIRSKSAEIGAAPLPFVGVFSAIGYLAAAIVLWLSLDDSFAKATAAVLLASACGIAVSALFRGLTDAAKAFLGFIPTVGCALLAIVYYFEKRLEMNAPLKISVMAGILLVMMYHLQQIRLRLGRTTPRLFVSFTFALLGIGALSAIPVPIAFLAGVFNRSETIASLPTLASVMRNPECLAGALIILGVCINAAVQSFGITEAPEAPDNTYESTSPDTLEDCEENE